MSSVISCYILLYLLREGILLNPEFYPCPGYPLFLPAKSWDCRQQPRLRSFHKGSGDLNFEACDSCNTDIPSAPGTVAALNYYRDWNAQP